MIPLRENRIYIINGPNLNMLGSRNPEIYGDVVFTEYLEVLRELFPSVQIFYLQSNHEGDIIDYLQREEVRSSYGVVLNAGAYAHYSYAIRDAIEDATCPVIEVHISKVAAREPHRHVTVITEACDGMIQGLGLDGYRLAIAHLISRR